ncbi:MAG TPA: hypothetical protein VGK00_00300 [Anaerolineales bacterium]|jgi:hypothetical protein
MLRAHATRGAIVEQTAAGWRLQIPGGAGGQYRLAQLDNYAGLKRKLFPNYYPAELNLACRASASELPGTWGFGFWNDPFAFSMGLRGMARRLPALPNACWFFNASAENHLSFHDGFAGNGFLTQCFRGVNLPTRVLLPGAIGAPLLWVRIVSKLARKFIGKLIAEQSRTLDLDVTTWHDYHLSWEKDVVSFGMDGTEIFRSTVSPQGPLGVVIWIDNQYAAWTPRGKIGMGTLAQAAPAWIEVKKVELKTRGL